MRILIHGLNFAPELVGVGKYTGEMAEWLAENGHDVRVVTAPPFNPASRVAPGYSSWHYRREERTYYRTENFAGGTSTLSERRYSASSGASAVCTSVSVEESRRVPSTVTDPVSEAGRLTVFRCPIWVPQAVSARKRVLHLMSFALTSFWSMLRQVPWAPEIVIVIEPTLFCAPNAWLTARVAGAKSWFHVQDFETDAAFELQLLSSPRLRQMATLLEQQCLRGFDKVSTISEKMRLRLLDKGLEPERCLLFPNWVDTKAIHPLQGPSPFREELGIDPNIVVALYSGTMAQKQGLDILAEVACKLQSHADLKFVFCGDGPGRPKLERMVAQLKNIRWLPLQPPERLNDLLNLADIHLLPQRANAADLVMPSKLTGMFASGRPVVAGAAGGTQLANVVDGRGIVVPPEDASAFAWAIEQLATHPALRDKLGRNARAYAVSELEKAVVLRRFEEDLCRVASSGAANRKLN